MRATTITGRTCRPRSLSERWAPLLAWGIPLCLASSAATAQVAVVANLTPQPATFEVHLVSALMQDGQPEKPAESGTQPSEPRKLALPPGDVAAVWVGRGAELRPEDNRAEASNGRSYWVQPGGAYFWSGEGEERALRSIELGEVDPSAYPGVPEITELTVKVLVDDDDPTVDRVWQRVLKARVEAASRILERTCRVRLRVIAFDRWESPAETAGLKDGALAFERLVEPGPAQLAIGFASQYRTLDRETPHLGIIRGSLGRHVLVRERAGRMSEPEKLEVLVHELGHYFGAVHVLHGRSVMRPRLADGRARMRGFRIVFDPINALIMNHYVTELHAGRTPDVFRPTVAARVSQLKRILARIQSPQQVSSPHSPARPEKPAPTRPAPRPSGTTSPTPVLDPLAQAVSALLGEFRNPAPVGTTGQALTQWYVRRVAIATQSLPADIGPRAFLIALGIGFDDTDLVRQTPAVGNWIRTLETEEERSVRLRHVKGVTLGGRHDWALHFFVSAMLTARYGPGAATVAGVLKELRDANGGTGLDRSDLRADVAGVAWAKRILSRRVLLLELVGGEHLPQIGRGRGGREKK